VFRCKNWLKSKRFFVKKAGIENYHGKSWSLKLIFSFEAGLRYIYIRKKIAGTALTTERQLKEKRIRSIYLPTWRSK
jgi:hypothetical protein